MAGGPVSEFIMLIGAIVAASALAATGIGATAEISQAYEVRLGDEENRLATDITIINDVRSVTVDPLELHVRNTGSEYLWPETFVVFVDGEVASNVTSSKTGIGPGQWTTLTVGGLSMAPGDHTALVYADHGASDELVFRVSAP